MAKITWNLAVWNGSKVVARAAVKATGTTTMDKIINHLLSKITVDGAVIDAITISKGLTEVGGKTE